jgi:hypothetical protein
VTPTDMSLWLTGQEASEAASYVIDVLLDEGSKTLYDHYLADREAAYATSRVLGDLQQLISLVYLPGDGEPGSDFGTFPRPCVHYLHAVLWSVRCD